MLALTNLKSSFHSFHCTKCQFSKIGLYTKWDYRKWNYIKLRDTLRLTLPISKMSFSFVEGFFRNRPGLTFETSNNIRPQAESGFGDQRELQKSKVWNKRFGISEPGRGIPFPLVHDLLYDHRKVFNINGGNFIGIRGVLFFLKFHDQIERIYLIQPKVRFANYL